jgi:hypothetical protein
MPAGMLRVIQVETEHFKRVSIDLCGHFGEKGSSLAFCFILKNTKFQATKQHYMQVYRSVMLSLLV